jgi:hypothetical protein
VFITSKTIFPKRGVLFQYKGAWLVSVSQRNNEKNKLTTHKYGWWWNFKFSDP